jgi:hypothetical protein
MFTDYYAHFGGGGGDGKHTVEDGLCGVTGERGLFFHRYWIQEEWRQQRALEKEIIRCNDEQPYINFQCRLAGCADLVHLRHPAVQRETLALITKATDLYTPEVQQCKKAGLKKHTVECIKTLFETLECTSVADIVAERVTKALCLPFSKQWIVDEIAQLNDMTKWLSKYVTGERRLCLRGDLCIGVIRGCECGTPQLLQAL